MASKSDLVVLSEDTERSIRPNLYTFKYMLLKKLEACLSRKFDSLFKHTINPKTLNQEQYNEIKSKFIANQMITFKSKYDAVLKEPSLVERIGQVNPKRSSNFEMEEATLTAKTLKPIKEEMVSEFEQLKSQVTHLKASEEKILASLRMELEETRDHYRRIKKKCFESLPIVHDKPDFIEFSALDELPDNNE